MSDWALVYGTACSEKGILPRDQYRDAQEVQELVLNGNCCERFSNRVTDVEAAALAQALGGTDCVTQLDLSYNSLTDEGAAQLAAALKQNKSLQHINLAYNSIEHKGWRAIANALVTNTTLLTLNISGNSITGESDPQKPGLREIGGKVIGSMLRENKTIQSLSFKSCGLGVCSLVGIAQALINHPSLTSLDVASPLLPSIQERTAVAQHFSEMLRKNDTLTELNLSRSLIGDEQLGMMLPAFVLNDGLRSVQLAGNRLSQDGGVEVAKLLARRHDLAYVDLSSNNLSTAGATAIANTLKPNKGITYLNLSHCGIGEDGLAAIAENLQHNHSITTLVLWGNHWTPKAARVFYAILPRLEELSDFDCEFQVVDSVPQVVLAEHGGVRTS